jgi:hypothetical protein
MKIAFYKMGLQNPVVRSQFGGMYTSFFSELSKYPGVTTTVINSLSNINNYDFLVIPMGDGQEQDGCKAMAAFRGPIILYVQPAYHWFKKSLLLHWKQKILFVYSTDASKYSSEEYKSIGLTHLHLPFASDSSVFYPLNSPKVFDVVFVGNAHSGSGRMAYINALVATAQRKKWKMLLVGSGWDSVGSPFAVIPHGPLLNLLYNSAKVCINISNDEQIRGNDICLDANNRLFDIAMSGSCQVSNGTELIEKYFTTSEVPSANSVKSWIQLINTMISNSKINLKTAELAHTKALINHTWGNRAALFLKTVLTTNKASTSATHKIYFMRFFDMYIPPFDFYYRIIKQILGKLRQRYAIT